MCHQTSKILAVAAFETRTIDLRSYGNGTREEGLRAKAKKIDELKQASVPLGGAPKF